MRSEVMKQRFGNKNAAAGENSTLNSDALSEAEDGYVIIALCLHINMQHTHMCRAA